MLDAIIYPKKIMEQLVNRVAQSGLITFNLEDLYPQEPIMEFDLKDHLFRGLILREKDFREALKSTDWTQYQGAHLAVFCSADAIIPVWAYQLLAIHAEPFVKSIHFGNQTVALQNLYNQSLSQLDLQRFSGQRVVIKGCSDKPVPASAYMELARLLRPMAKSIMYGEPCSTVPLYKM